jgi:hypothetical protein
VHTTKEFHMTRFMISAIAFGVLAASTLVIAQTPAAPPMKSDSVQAMPGMDMKGQMAQMDVHMSQMQAIHEKMVRATTPEERRKVMEEQRKAMQESMGTTNHMMQGGGMMAGPGGGMMGGKASGMAADKGMVGDTGAQMQFMQKRMDMMQMMMQSMMDQQGMTVSPGAPGPAPKK